MQTKDDLLALLNSAKPLLYGPRTVRFEKRHINWYAGPKLNTKRYRQFTIKKRSGGDRTIHAPVKGLKAIQRTLAFILQCVFEPHKAATGFVKGRSIIDNAKVHIGNRYIYNIDLKDFFSTIDQARVWKCLQLRPFGLSNDQKSTSQRLALANIVASLCCAEIEVERLNEQGKWTLVKRNVLPQGAPTSPVLSNVICQRLDYLLTAVAKRFGLQYTRYADDLTFSSMHDVYGEDQEFVKELRRIVTDQRFYIKASKTRLQKEGSRQEVTGLLVNKKINVQKGYIKELRMWLNYWERYGYKKVESFFVQHQSGAGEKAPNMHSVIQGKLTFLKMVKGVGDTTYAKLKERYDALTKNGGSKLPATAKPAAITAVPMRDKPLFPHDPIYTVKFLMNFKTGDGSGFKELVHDTELSDEIIDGILNKVKNDPNFIYTYRKEWLENISFLNAKLQGAVKLLIDHFEKEGIPYFKRTGRHPYNNDEIYSKAVKKFKRNYRYGSGDEYSKFLQDLTNKFSEQGIPEACLIIAPDVRRFNIRATFFTWKPSLLLGIKYLIEGIKNHRNINGEPVSDMTNKMISIEIERVERHGVFYIELRILDLLSQVSIDKNRLWLYLTRSATYKDHFRNLCDWIVECDLADDEVPCRLNLLTAKGLYPEQSEIEPLNKPVGGYKNILRFYESR